MRVSAQVLFEVCLKIYIDKRNLNNIVVVIVVVVCVHVCVRVKLFFSTKYR